MRKRLPTLPATLHFALLFAAAFIATIATAQSQTPPKADFVGDPRLGTCTHFSQGWDYKKLMPIVARSGLGWIREDVWWESVESQKGVYKLPEWTEAWIHAAHANHLRLLLILNGGNKLYADHYDPQAYANWATWMTKELKGNVDAVEILNEPNNFGFSQFYGGQHDGEGNSPWVAKYVRLMNRAAEAIKAVDPAMPVVGFGAGAPVTYKQLELGATPHVDAIADHPYSNHQVPELLPTTGAGQLKHFGFATTDERGSFASLVEGFRRQSAAHAGPKEIWLTEWGFSTYQPLTAEQFGGFTESAQAKYILRRYMEGVGLGVQVSFLYDFRDGGDEHNAEDRWGLVRENGDPKESYKAVVNLAAAIHEFRAPAKDDPREVNVFPAACWPKQAPIAVYPLVYRAGFPAVAIWATDAAGSDLQPRVADVELVWGTNVKVVTAVDTLTGARETVPFQHRRGRLLHEAMTIHDYPLILVGSEPLSQTPSEFVDRDQTDLHLFDAGREWVFVDGAEFPGAAGSFALAKDGGKPEGAVHYDFRHGGNYVAADTSAKIGETAGELRIGVKASQPLKISIRLIDQTDQCHQFATAYGGSESWETLRVGLNRSASEHWGGANDGRLHFPIRKVSLGVQRPAGEPVGTVEFADAVTLPK